MQYVCITAFLVFSEKVCAQWVDQNVMVLFQLVLSNSFDFVGSHVFCVMTPEHNRGKIWKIGKRRYYKGETSLPDVTWCKISALPTAHFQ